MNTNKTAIFAIVLSIMAIFAVGCGGTASGASPASPASRPSIVQQQLPSAAALAKQLGGTKFVQDNVGPVPNPVTGQTSVGHFFIGNDFYMVTVFKDAGSMNKWMKQWAGYGMTPKWKGTSWLVIPVDSHFHGPTLPMPTSH